MVVGLLLSSDLARFEDGSASSSSGTVPGMGRLRTEELLTSWLERVRTRGQCLDTKGGMGEWAMGDAAQMQVAMDALQRMDVVMGQW